MGKRTSGTFTKGDPRAIENAPKAFKARIRARGRRNGKKRWASMTQEEKEWVWMKRDYANATRRKRRERLNRDLARTTHFKVPPTATDDEMDDLENFFYGDVI